MPDYIATQDLADDIVAKLPPLKANRAMEDAVKGVLDTVLEQTEAMVADAIARAVEKVDAEAPELSMSDFADLSDVAGREIGAMVSEGNSLERQTFLRGFIDSLDCAALDDLHAELLRR